MYRSLDLRRTVEIDSGYEERRHLHPIHEVVKAPMLLGYPNLLAAKALELASDGLKRMLADADVILSREPWQIPFVLDHAPVDVPVLFSSHNVESERFSKIEQPLFDERVACQVHELERRAVDEADAIVCTSERDESEYRRVYDCDGPFIVAPNGTYEKNIREHRAGSARAQAVRRKYGITGTETVCLFMGSNYQPNVDAAKAAIDIICSRANGDSTHLLIVGSVGKALNRADLPENVIVTGYLESDFEAHFDAADIALNPTRIGGGTNIKIIDYMARSLPIVSTSFGARGIDLADGRHLLIRDLDEFNEAIDLLENDVQRCRQLGLAARKLAEERYTWEAASRDLRRRIVDLFGPF